MSTTVDNKNINKTEAVATKNDWDDDEDDNWDDWGDAEDNTAVTVAGTTAPKITTPKVSSDSQSANYNKTNNNVTKDSNCNSNNEIAQPTPQAESKSWGSVWKPWGGVVSSVLSTASEGLGNITSTVSQGLNNVIGVPDPEEMARINADAESKEEPKQSVDKDLKENDELSKTTPVFGLSLVSGVTTLGSKVLHSGLDTLEGIGKKTMNILQENDPLLMNKRKMLGLEQEKPNLSDILKEAKQESDQLEHTLKELQLEKSKELLRFDILFENHCGLVHLEALEILSKESDIKLKSLQNSVSGNALSELQETLHEVKELLELEDLEGESDGEYAAEALNEQLLTAIEDADLQITFDELKNNWAVALTWLESDVAAAADVSEQFAKGIGALAECCALEINKLHKIAELLLVKEHHSTANEVDGIVQLCKQFALHLHGVANRFAAMLSASQDDSAKAQINTLFAELCLAMQQLEKAFKLFLPILQIGAV